MSWVHEAALKHFNSHPNEEFMKYFGDVFRVVYASEHRYKSSTYSYYILKPYSRPSQRYGIGEIIALYSPYPEIQAREIDALIELQQTIHSNRVHQVWNILITDSERPVADLEALTKDKDLEVYSIPFSKTELDKKPSSDFIHDRLKSYIQDRDLFDSQSALRSKLFFFGRDDLVNRLIAAVEKGQNFGLFGLRKVGKTSLLYALEMYLERVKTHTVVHIDCQTPAIYLKRWDSLLAFIYEKLTNETMSFQSPDRVAEAFSKAVTQHSKKVLLVFDEIENISFGGLSQARHWNDDFLPFWGTIRAAHQEGKMTFGVAGVNPRIFETPVIGGSDNPLMLGATNVNVNFLDEVSIKRMVKTIGEYMGLEIEGGVYPWLYQQYGGHPLLTRKACSLVYNKARISSGDQLALASFTSRQDWLDQQLGQNVLNILAVLIQHYPNEYDHLMAIAKGDGELFEFLLKDAQYESELKHILSYNILKSSKQHEPIFIIEALRRFLVQSGESAREAIGELSRSSTPTAYEVLPQPDQLDLWARLSRARNQLETQLRKVILQALLFKYGEKAARKYVIESFPNDRKKNFEGHSLHEIFSGDSKLLFFIDLKNLVNRNWELMQHVFDNDKKAFQLRMDRINSDGRADAHANNISEKEVIQLEAYITEILNQIDPFL